MTLLVLSVAVLVGSGLAALPFWHDSRRASWIGALGAVSGCTVGLVPAFDTLLAGARAEIAVPWPLRTGSLVAGLDELSAFFLIPLLVLAAIAAAYGRAYLAPSSSRRALAPAALFYNLLVASMVCVLVARDALFFLVAWEVMSLAAYLLISFEHEDAVVRRAGWVYLIAAHVGVACLILMFLVLSTGGLEFDSLHATNAGRAALAFALAFAGFGVKAGVVPLHVWLPEAHAAAPSHVSALMSGVLIKMGLYGLLRVITLVPAAAWWGPMLMIAGLGGALVGISLALYQRDLKRVLAYSSIENVGLMLLGLGLGLWGASRGEVVVAALGLGGALLHVWSHALMKGLLFLSAGSVLHGAGEKDIERLGGLMRRMPSTGALMTVGAAAIAGLPPLCGFVSEWLIYLGLIRHGLGTPSPSGVAAWLAVGVVALVGGLAAIGFVRLVGVVLLGEPRSEAAARAHESPASMTGAMAILGAAIVAGALVPHRLLSAIAPVVAVIGGPAVADAMVKVASSARVLAIASAVLWITLGAVAVVLVAATRRRVALDQTWGCGYAAPTARMQYSGRSFAESLAEKILPRPLRPRVRVRAPEGIFPGGGELSTDCADPLTRGWYEPLLSRWADRFARLRWLQQGNLHVYVLYLLIAVVAALAWVSLRAWIA